MWKNRPETTLVNSAHKVIAQLQREAAVLGAMAKCQAEIHTYINSLPVNDCVIDGHDDSARNCELRLTALRSDRGETHLRVWRCGYAGATIRLAAVMTGEEADFYEEALIETLFGISFQTFVEPIRAILCKDAIRTLILASRRRHGLPRLPTEIWLYIYRNFVQCR
jgi:hypothetical protein